MSLFQDNFVWCTGNNFYTQIGGKAIFPPSVLYDAYTAIEVKTKKSSEAIRNADSATQVLREMKISRTDLSKYCIGLVLTKSKVKYNRFKRKILLINRLVDSHDEL